MGHWDLSGINYFNPYDYPLNYYTDEILDSLLSLSRFVSLVQWRHVSDPEQYPPDMRSQIAPYRPMRITRNEPGGPRVGLKAGPAGPPLSENDWLWTGASDTYITVGWIVRNYAQNYGVPECEDPIGPAQPPWVEISNLASGLALELAWFDDQRGCLIGDRTISTTGQFNVPASSTEPGGFGKSIAFLIQPLGFTGSQDFEPLPNEKIGQIVISPRDWQHCYEWHDERPEVVKNALLTFTAWTKPQITNPIGYNFRWHFADTGATQDNGPSVSHTFTQPSGADGRKVTVEIFDPQGKRISGDIIYVYVPNW
jgi:hypothetical protein